MVERTQEEVRQILEHYKLSQEEHDEIFETIKRVWTAEKTPVDSPVAVVIGGQTGAGKSGIISSSIDTFPSGNVVIINSDELKPFHPAENEIAKLYPDLYTMITDQESNTWTSDLFRFLRENGYNIIFEGTMKNNRVADDAIAELKRLGYTVIVRVLAVCDLESMISVIGRYLGQLETKSYGRLVAVDHHNATYNGVPNTVEYIERTGAYDVLEVFKRGDNIGKPVMVYSAINPETQNQTIARLQGMPNVSLRNNRFGFNSAREAILRTRTENYDEVLSKFSDKIDPLIASGNPDIIPHLEWIESKYAELTGGSLKKN